MCLTYVIAATDSLRWQVYGTGKGTNHLVEQIIITGQRGQHKPLEMILGKDESPEVEDTLRIKQEQQQKRNRNNDNKRLACLFCLKWTKHLPCYQFVKMEDFTRTTCFDASVGYSVVYISLKKNVSLD